MLSRMRHSTSHVCSALATRGCKRAMVHYAASARRFGRGADPSRRDVWCIAMLGLGATGALVADGPIHAEQFRMTSSQSLHPVHLAARRGDRLTMAQLMDRGTPVDVRDKQGFTPL